jgi:hypothetical protein
VWLSPKEMFDAFGLLMLVGAFLGAVTSVPIFLTMRRKENLTV